jgi:dihydrofolate reductase
MGQIIISENVSLDGVVQDPTGEEGFERGGWFPHIGGTDREAWAKLEFDQALAAEALLMGRRTDDFFGSRWPTRAGAWADRLNSMPKYVVSSTVHSAKWSNSTVLRGDVVDEVSNLKQQLDGDIVVYASAQLVQTLIENDLIDEMRLIIHPVVLGAGRRLFGETSAAKRMRLVDTRTVGDSLAFITYRPG